MANKKAPRAKAVKKVAGKRAGAKAKAKAKAGAKVVKRAPAKREAVVTAGSGGQQPRVMRPTVPADYHFPTGPEGMLDWSWARERLTKSQNYVIVTVRPDSRPHAMGMHGLWWGDAYYFGTGLETRKAKNLGTNPHCVLVAEDFNELIIVEGMAEIIGYDRLPAGLSDASKKKYGWPVDPRSGGVVFKLVPRVVFAFPLKQITTAVTKWVFE